MSEPASKTSVTNTDARDNHMSLEARQFLQELERIVSPMAKQLQSSLRLRWLRWGVGLALVIGVLMINLFSPKIQQYFTLDNNYVAVVPIKGVIMDDSTGAPEKVIPLLEKAFKDSGAKGVIVAINSPGGTPVAADAIRDRIVMLREAYPDKKLVVVGKDYLTSGAYLAALAADQIFASEASNVGSIGVIIRSFGFQELADRFGVERRVLKAGENKAGMDQWLPINEADKHEYQAQLNEIHKWFITRVRESRGDKLHETDEMFTGKIWLGKEALDLGLIDGIGTVASVSEAVFGTTNHRMYSPKESLKSLLNPFGGAASAFSDFNVQLSTLASPIGGLLMPE